jgi:hypothetical protein
MVFGLLVLLSGCEDPKRKLLPRITDPIVGTWVEIGAYRNAFTFRADGTCVYQADLTTLDKYAHQEATQEFIRLVRDSESVPWRYSRGSQKLILRAPPGTVRSKIAIPFGPSGKKDAATNLDIYFKYKLDRDILETEEEDTPKTATYTRQ